MKPDSAPPRHLILVCAAAVLPLLAVSVCSLWIIAGSAAGADPFWPAPEPPLNVAEAAAVGNLGEVVRLITMEGQDPNGAWPVRSGLPGGGRTMTPLEAARIDRSDDTVTVLVQHGAISRE